MLITTLEGIKYSTKTQRFKFNFPTRIKYDVHAYLSFILGWE